MFLYPWVLAEAQAFPFWAPVAAELRLLGLGRPTVGVLDSGGERLSAALEAHVLPRAPGLSLDGLRQLRDQAWFALGSRLADGGAAAEDPLARRQPVLRRSLAEHLGDLARQLLEPRGGRVGLRHGDDPAEVAARFRWLSLCMPPDLLVAALSHDCGWLPSEDAVELLTPQLAQLLSQPCAETHLHAGSATPFGLLWSGLLRGLSDQPPLPSELGGVLPSAPEGEAARLLLLSAASTRVLLAAFLLWRTRGSRPEVRKFAHFSVGNEAPLFTDIAPRLGYSGSRIDAYRSLLQLLQALYFGSPAAAQRQGLCRELTSQRAQALYRALIGPPPRLAAKQARSARAAFARDPLSCEQPGLWSAARTTPPELLFAYRGLSYLSQEGRDDSDFATLFWQYQRVRCQVYRSLTEAPGTPGLDWFGRFFERIRPLRRAIADQLVAVALSGQSRDLQLGALEVRTAPEKSRDKIRDLLRGVAQQAIDFEPTPGHPRPELGVVLHFKKERLRKTPQGGRPHADPRTGAYGVRYGAWFHERLQEATAIGATLSNQPELLLLLRGIDIASAELSQPTWVALPLFFQVRRDANRAAAKLASSRPGWRVPPLRTTLHAGEDFRRLVEGLRRIAEPIESGLLRAGDRLGHAVALGTAVETEEDRRIAQPCEERLDDLLWELDLYRRAVLPDDVSRLEYVRFAVRELGRRIYEDEVTAESLLLARRLRHDPQVLQRLGFPFARGPQPDRASGSATGGLALLQRFLRDADVYLRGQEPIEVRCDGREKKALLGMQRYLRQELGRLEITVESNPSSNLLIGDTGTFEQIPALRLQPVRPAPSSDAARGSPAEPPVLVSLNTDNPLTFASCLADEFAHTYFALIRLGVGAAEALAWLDRAREVGWRSRFTLRQSTDLPALAALLPPRS